MPQQAERACDAPALERRLVSKGLKLFFETGKKTGIQPAHAPKLSAQLARLVVARAPQDMNVPGWKLHPLKGDFGGHWSVWVKGNWRMPSPSKMATQSWWTTRTTTEGAMTMGQMYNPPHPGLTLRDDVLPAVRRSRGGRCAAARFGDRDDK